LLTFTVEENILISSVLAVLVWPTPVEMTPRLCVTNAQINNQNALIQNESVLPINPFIAADNETFRRVSIQHLNSASRRNGVLEHFVPL